MLVLTVPLGTAETLTQLYSYPNIPGSSETLIDTITHWFGQTLQRDGFTDQGAQFNVQVDPTGQYSIHLIGSPPISNDLLAYVSRLPQFLQNGWGALSGSIPALKAANLWDPQNNGWRFMLPQGMAMVRHRALQLFHFPPMNLLNPSRDYLDDSVPVRCDELLQANGITDPDDLFLLSRVVDCAPIAAGDDQGAYISPTVTPTDYFADYQRSQIELLHPRREPGDDGRDPARVDDAGAGREPPVLLLRAGAGLQHGGRREDDRSAVPRRDDTHGAGSRGRPLARHHGGRPEPEPTGGAHRRHRVLERSGASGLGMRACTTRGLAVLPGREPGGVQLPDVTGAGRGLLPGERQQPLRLKH